MKSYSVEISSSAERTLFRLSREAVVKVVSALQKLAIEPRPAGCRKLSGQQDTYRIRVGVYRIIYEIHDDIVLVRVLKVGHRREVYR